MQWLSEVNWVQRTPAGLGLDIPGIAVLMLIAMQHAPQPGRHVASTSKTKSTG